MAFYYQKLQFIVLSVVVVGIVDYFFIYELFISLSTLVPVFFLEIGPIMLIILSVIILRGVFKFIRKKMKENKHLLLF
ncbi:hypothetical protein [Paenibacillus monticola]|uniref:Uncharacterized protein n=1 Tax=Paenibacillus monticola TaxID=2666075 RepID=A0A7X2H536_9BACL|nr:hypothetical protein [Paenibacillus monticola]MRN53759.1 hypothetical protein [Paenibacillus monticola]